MNTSDRNTRFELLGLEKSGEALRLTMVTFGTYYFCDFFFLQSVVFLFLNHYPTPSPSTCWLSDLVGYILDDTLNKKAVSLAPAGSEERGFFFALFSLFLKKSCLTSM